MCIFLYLPEIFPSESMMTAVLWYTPAARLSKSEARITTLCCRATFPSASVVGPGISSASLNSAMSSVWQKYCERKSSCKQTICAPFLTASPMRAIAFLRFLSGFLHPDLFALHRHSQQITAHVYSSRARFLHACRVASPRRDMVVMAQRSRDVARSSASSRTNLSADDGGAGTERDREPVGE